MFALLAGVQQILLLHDGFDGHERRVRISSSTGADAARTLLHREYASQSVSPKISCTGGSKGVSPQSRGALLRSHKRRMKRLKGTPG